MAYRFPLTPFKLQQLQSKEMNFLNKKYTSLHGTSPYQSNSRSFLPSATTIRDSPPSVSSNNCDAHPSEIVRHMCVECVELLCAQCISEHLELHREANMIPKIMSIRQLRGDMETKIEQITHLIGSQNPSLMDIDSLRKHALDKVESMRKDLMRAVDDWIGILKGHLLNTLGFEDVAKNKAEMERLREQVHLLQQALSTAGQPAVVKKIFQIDAEKLKEGYKNMIARFKRLQEKADFDISMNWKEIIKGFEENVVVNFKQETIEQEGELQQESRRPSSQSSRTYNQQSGGE